MSYGNRSILKYINKPAKVILWDIDEAMAFCMPFAFLVIAGHLVWGIVFGWATVLGMRVIKSAVGISTFAHLAYWYLPTSRRAYKIYIPSHIREFIG